MEKPTEDQETIIYKYERDGKVYHTPNESIASQRSDTGEYFIEVHNKQSENNLKD